MRLCQTFKHIARMGILALSLLFSSIMVQAEVPMCQQLFISQERLTEQMALLARVKINLNSNGYNELPGLRRQVELKYQAELSDTVRRFPYAMRIYLNELEKIDPTSALKKQEKRIQKESKILVEYSLTQLLRMQFDQNFSKNVTSFLSNLDLPTRRSVVSAIKMDWLKRDIGTEERVFASRYFEILQETVLSGNLMQLKELVELEMFHLNDKNESGFSILLVADYAEQIEVINWILQSSAFDLNQKNSQGYTDVEMLRLMNRSERADYIEQMRPDSVARKFEVKERNEDGSPMSRFVRIEPGTFRMGLENKVSVKISNAFDFMSVKLPQKTWQGVVALVNLYLKNKYNLQALPSSVVAENHPVEKVSYLQAQDWLNALNELSLIQDVNVQIALGQLFTDHQLGDIYRLPTEAEWEYVARRMGLAVGDYSFGVNDKEIDAYAFHSLNGFEKTHSVGQKKPMFIFGEPIYEIHGNVAELTSDGYQKDLPGGADPRVDPAGKNIVTRGCACVSVPNAKYLRSGVRNHTLQDSRMSTIGIRLVRVRP